MSQQAYTVDKCAQTFPTALHDRMVVGTQNAFDCCRECCIDEDCAQRLCRMPHNRLKNVECGVLHQMFLLQIDPILQTQNAHLECGAHCIVSVRK